MRGFRLAATVSAITLSATVCAVAPPAAADGDFGVALNGTYRVFSDGQWAKRGMAPGGGEVFFRIPSVTQTWTISTQCVSPIECVGEVKSDLGWTGTIRIDDHWYVDHDVPNWLPCPDGSFAPGHQKFILTGWNPETAQRTIKNRDFLMGRDVTKSPSGACGRNQPVVVEMPVRLERV